MKKLFKYKLLKRLYNYFKIKIAQSIRARLIAIVLLCMFISFLSILIVYSIILSVNDSGRNNDIYMLDHELREIVSEIRNVTKDKSLGDLNRIKDIFDRRIKYTKLELESINAYVLDRNGNILLQTGNLPKTDQDTSYIIKDALNSDLRNIRWVQSSLYNYKEAVYIKKMNFDDDTTIYFILDGLAKKRAIADDRGSELIVPLIIGAIVFVFSFFLLTRKEVDYIEELSSGISEISKGNLDYRVKLKTKDELGLLASRINSMVEELKVKIEEERKAEKTKKELITNMSHDLRTPLTSVMGYLRMLKDKKYEDSREQEEYIDIAFTKSEKLKTLIDDLFMYSKLSNEDTILYKEKICLNDMLAQLIEELTPVGEESNLNFVREIQHERVMVEVDANMMVRVFENLITNAVKYSYSPGEIRICLASDQETVTVSVINKGDNIPREELPLLFDRLYMVDKSRSSEKNGSGLGLAISKSIVKLHNGTIWAECEGNEVSFHVRLPKL